MASKILERARLETRFRKILGSLTVHIILSDLQIDLLRRHCGLEPKKPIKEKPEVCDALLKEMLRFAKIPSP